MGLEEKIYKRVTRYQDESNDRCIISKSDYPFMCYNLQENIRTGHTYISTDHNITYLYGLAEVAWEFRYKLTIYHSSLENTHIRVYNAYFR